MCFLMAPQDRIQNCFAEEKQTDVKVLSMHFFDDLICFGPFFSFFDVNGTTSPHSFATFEPCDCHHSARGTPVIHMKFPEQCVTICFAYDV